jgi:hypothetical protein
MPRLVTAIVERVTAVAPKTSLLFVITIMTAVSEGKFIVSMPNLTQGKQFKVPNSKFKIQNSK